MFKSLISRISIVYVGLVGLIAVIGLASTFNLVRLERSVDGLLSDNYKSIKAISHMMETVERQDSAVLMYLNIDKERGLELFSQNNQMFMEWFVVQKNNITEVSEAELVDDLALQYKEYVNIFLKLQEIRNTKEDEDAIKYYNEEILTKFSQIKRILSDLFVLNENAMYENNQRTSDNSRQSMYFILILSLISVAGGFAASRFFAHRFLAPIKQLSEGISRVKSGELNQYIEINTGDEVQELSKQFNDMTQRLYQFEQSTIGILMAEKNKSLAIVKSIADPLLVLDVNYRIILINDACESFFSINEKRYINRHILEAIGNGELFDHISNVVESSEDQKEKIICFDNEDAFYFNIIVTVVRQSDGSISNIIVLMQNISELKELEKVKTDFIANISHELRTPLTSILMGISILSETDKINLNSDEKDIIETIKEDSEHLEHLVNELLELSRLESGKAIFRKDFYSINKVLTSSIKQFQEYADRKGILLKDDSDYNLPILYGDSDKITWAINNLISNSLKYSDEGDTVFVYAKADEKKVTLFVKDSGPGIPIEYVDDIFDRFVQVKGQGVEIKGIGLGLSVVKEIVKAHGGKVWCESKVDSGSTFIIELPLYSKEDLNE